MSPDEIYAIVEKNGGNGANLIGILSEVQARYSYLPREALELVATQTNRSLVDIYNVATFYRAFSLNPRGRHLVSVCLGTACHVRRSPITLNEVEHQLSIKAGATTSDREFTLETVNCLGACALGPVMVIDGHYFPHVTATKVSEILELASNGLDKVEVTTDQRIFPVEVSCARCNHSLMDGKRLLDDHPSIRVDISFGGNIGWLRLSSLYGSHNAAAEMDIPADALVNFFCPHCNGELRGATRCPDCNSKMVPMIVKGGGVVQICPRRGCKGHLLDVA